MKILIISSEFPPGPGGIGEHAYRMALALHRRGHEVCVLTPGDYATKQEVVEFDINNPSLLIKRYHRLGLVFTQLNRIWVTSKFIIREKYTTLIMTGKFSLWQNLLFKVVLGNRIWSMAVVHGSEIYMPNSVSRWVTQAGIRRADRIVAVSRYTKSLLEKKAMIDPSKIIVVQNGIDISCFPPLMVPKVKLNGKPCLLTVGHVTPRKGQHRVIKALPRIISKWPDVHYHIVGFPNDQKRLEDLAKSLNVFDYITFHGRIPDHTDLFNFYQSCDIFLLLSENQLNGDVEGFGIVALEANYFGKPVIGAIGCGIEDAVSEDSSGYLIDGNDSVAVVQAIELCLANSSRLSESSRHWALSHSWGKMALKLEDLLP